MSKTTFDKKSWFTPFHLVSVVWSVRFAESNPDLMKHAMLVENHVSPTQIKCQSTQFLQCCLQWSPNSGSRVFVWIFFLTGMTESSPLPRLWFTTTETNKLQACVWPSKSVLLNDSIPPFIMVFTPCIPNEALSTNRLVGKARHLCFVYFSLSLCLSVAPSISLLFWKINYSS